MSDVPPERQCTMCDREAVDPSRNGALCEEHLRTVESGGEDTRSDRSNPRGETSETTTRHGETVEIDHGVFPEDLKDVEQWLTWKQTDDGRKVPRAPYENRDWPDKFVSAQDPDVWRDFETAAKWCDRLPGYDLAFNIRGREEFPAEEFVLIDYDDARDPETEEIHPTVREHIARAESYADISTSGTGVHIFCRGGLPDGVKAITADLPHDDRYPGAEIEVYDSARFSAMTGDHIATSPRETSNCQAFLDELAETYATIAEGTPDELTREPEKSVEELADVEDTTDIQDVLDAIQHTGPRDIRVRSTLTQERGDGTKSMDPSWAQSDSGTRLAQVDDGWVYRKGMRGLDALQLVALEERIITHTDEYPSGEAFWDAVEALRKRGAHIPEYAPGEHARDMDPVAALPSSEGVTDPASGWDWRHAGERATRDVDPVTDARQRTTDTIADALESGDRVLIEALMSLGKSYGAVEAAAETDVPVTILTTRGRKEQYQQIREWCEEHGLSHYTLPAFKRDCDTANGEYREDWAEKADRWYANAATPQDIHKHAEYHLERPLPCQEHEHQECPYTAKWRFEADEYDVLIGHPMHSYNDKVVAGRAVIFDEFDGQAFETSFSHRLQSAVSNFLAEEPALPFEDYTDLVEGRNDPERRAKGIEWFHENGVKRDPFAAFSAGSGHAEAPLAAFTILQGGVNNLENGWERVEFPNSDRVGTFDRENGRVHILSPPDLNYTKAVLALDGTPTREMWELALGQRLNHRKVLTTPERREYIREGLNLNIVRTSDAVKPYNSDQNVNVEQDAALLEAIAEQHGRPVGGLISTRTALREYENAELLRFDDDTRKVSAGPAESVNWHGNVHGSNEYEETRIGAVVGSTHYGDGFVKKWGAYAGEAIERGDGRGAELSYGEFGDKILHHMREHDTLQATMRFGRDGNGSVVYVHTDTLPDWVPVAGEGRVIRPWSDGMKQVIEAAAELDTWRTAEIAEHPDVEPDQRQVFNILNDLADLGYVTRQWEGRGYTWSEEGIHRINEHGDVELDPVDFEEAAEAEVAEMVRSSNYTWSFRNFGGDTGDDPPTAAGGGSQPPSAPADGGDGPPDPGD